MIKDRFIRDKECREATGLSRTTRWRLEQVDLFPKRHLIGKQAIGWLESEIQQWMNSRPHDEKREA